MSEVGVISVGVEAQLGQLDRGLKQAEGMVRQQTENMKRISAVDLFSGHFAKLALGGIVGLHAVKGAIESIVGVTQLFNGETEKAVESFGKLPLIGRFIVTPLHDAYMELSGAREEMEKIVKLEKEEEENIKRIKSLRDEIAVNTARERGGPVAAKRESENRDFESKIRPAREKLVELQSQENERMLENDRRAEDGREQLDHNATMAIIASRKDAQEIIESLEKLHIQNLHKIDMEEISNREKLNHELQEADDRMVEEALEGERKIQSERLRTGMELERINQRQREEHAKELDKELDEQLKQQKAPKDIRENAHRFSSEQIVLSRAVIEIPTVNPNSPAVMQLAEAKKANAILQKIEVDARAFQDLSRNMAGVW